MTKFAKGDNSTKDFFLISPRLSTHYSLQAGGREGCLSEPPEPPLVPPLSVCVLCLFLTVQWVGLQSLTVSFPGHTHLLFIV